MRISIVGFANYTYSQIQFIEPSFEHGENWGGNAFGWDSCSGSVVPIFPNSNAPNVFICPPPNGNFYMLIEDDAIQRGKVSTRLSCPLIKDKKHLFSFYAMNCFPRYDEAKTFGYLKLSLGSDKCDIQQLIFSTAILDTFQWHKQIVEFVPNDYYQYLIIEVKKDTGIGIASLLIDAFSPIEIENLGGINAYATKTNIVAGEVVQLNSIVNSSMVLPPYQLQWSNNTDTSFSNNNQNFYASPLQTTTYYVSIKDTCGYSAWDSVTVQVQPNNSFIIQQHKNTWDLHYLLPNYNGTIAIYNTLGQLEKSVALSQTLNESVITVSTASFVSGFYFVVLYSNGKIVGKQKVWKE